MELRQVRYFLTLAETLNFTRAAEACNVTQPALTNSIKKLEEEMGGLLVHRERANSHLTELGQMMLPFLQQVYDSSCAASRLAKELQQGTRVPLNFGASDVVPKAALIAPVRSAHAAADGLEIHIEGGSDLSLVERLNEGALHLALVEEAAVDKDRLRFHPVYTETYAVLLPDGDDLAASNALSFGQIMQREWIELIGSSAHASVIAALQEVDKGFTSRHRATRSVETQTLCLAGAGITLVGDREAVLPGLVTRPLVDMCLTRQIGLAEARGRPTSGTVQSFSRLLRSQSFNGSALGSATEASMSRGSGRLVKSDPPRDAMT